MLIGGGAFSNGGSGFTRGGFARTYLVVVGILLLLNSFVDCCQFSSKDHEESNQPSSLSRYPLLTKFPLAIADTTRKVFGHVSPTPSDVSANSVELHGNKIKANAFKPSTEATTKQSSEKQATRREALLWRGRSRSNSHQQKNARKDDISNLNNARRSRYSFEKQESSRFNRKNGSPTSKATVYKPWQDTLRRERKEFFRQSLERHQTSRSQHSDEHTHTQRILNQRGARLERYLSDSDKRNNVHHNLERSVNSRRLTENLFDDRRNQIRRSTEREHNRRLVQLSRALKSLKIDEMVRNDVKQKKVSRSLKRRERQVQESRSLDNASNIRKSMERKEKSNRLMKDPTTSRHTNIRRESRSDSSRRSWEHEMDSIRIPSYETRRSSRMIDEKQFERKNTDTTASRNKGKEDRNQKEFTSEVRQDGRRSSEREDSIWTRETRSDEMRRVRRSIRESMGPNASVVRRIDTNARFEDRRNDVRRSLEHGESMPVQNYKVTSLSRRQEIRVIPKYNEVSERQNKRLETRRAEKNRSADRRREDIKSLNERRESRRTSDDITKSPEKIKDATYARRFVGYQSSRRNEVRPESMRILSDRSMRRHADMGQNGENRHRSDRTYILQRKETRNSAENFKKRFLNQGRKSLRRQYVIPTFRVRELSTRVQDETSVRKPSASRRISGEQQQSVQKSLKSHNHSPDSIEQSDSQEKTPKIESQKNLRHSWEVARFLLQIFVDRNEDEFKPTSKGGRKSGTNLELVHEKAALSNNGLFGSAIIGEDVQSNPGSLGESLLRGLYTGVASVAIYHALPRHVIKGLTAAI